MDIHHLTLRKYDWKISQASTANLSSISIFTALFEKTLSKNYPEIV